MTLGARRLSVLCAPRISPGSEAIGEREADMIEGRVLRYDDDRAFGFIVAGEPPRNYFVHVTDLVDSLGYQDLVSGERVRFRPVQTDKGLRAREVRRMGPRSCRL